MSEHFKQLNVNATKAHRLTYPSARNAQIEEISLPPLKSTDVLVEALFSGISRGTERLVYNGLVPENLWETMKCPHQQGGFGFPVTYGYSFTGCVREVGKDVTNLQVGDEVFVLHPHQDWIVVDGSCCHRLPGGLSPGKAVLSANAETALNAVWDAELEKQDRVVVFGAGIVGLLVASFAARVVSVQVTIVDKLESRRKVSENLGLQFCTTTEFRAQKPVFNCLFNTTASGEALQDAINCAAFEGRIIELSWYGSNSVQLGLGGRFHSHRLKIISSQVGSISAAKRSCVSTNERMELAMEELCHSKFDQLLDPSFSFLEAPSLLPEIFDPNEDYLCPLIRYT